MKLTDGEVKLHQLASSPGRIQSTFSMTGSRRWNVQASRMFGRKRSLQEWNLLSDEERATFDTAVKSLRGRIDASSKAVAAQDFRHLRQGDPESVSDLMTWSDCSIPAPRPRCDHVNR